MEDDKKKKIGKFISLVLRHSPETIGLKLDENGWADVKELIEKSKTKKYFFSFDDLVEIVETNDKKRYSFNDKKTKIRANQGHSIDVDLNLQPIEPPAYLYHGTATRFVGSIRKEGILKGSRQHVHLSKDKETATKVGIRHGKPEVLTIRSGKMYEDGVLFYQSDNGVWLTDYVDPKYIE